MKEEEGRVNRQEQELDYSVILTFATVDHALYCLVEFLQMSV